MLKLVYYDYSKLLSFNGVYNLLIGNRGKGKTYGAKKKSIKDGILKGDQFIYLRRYKEELGIARTTFFEDIKDEFPGYDFRISNLGKLQVAQWSHVIDREFKDREWNTIGIFVALSQSQNYKSASFPMVKTIIFDEFIIEKGNSTYITDEVTKFNNFYSTVDRWKDKTRVFFLANSVSMMNPYFIEWAIRPVEGDEFIIKMKGFLVCHIANNEDFNASVMHTRFGEFISGTEYAKYAVDNTFADNHESMLDAKPSTARYQFTIETKTGQFSVWYDFSVNYYWIQEKLTKGEKVYTIISNKMDNDKVFIGFSDKPLQNLRASYRKGQMSFDNQVTRNTFMEIFKR